MAFPCSRQVIKPVLDTPQDILEVAKAFFPCSRIRKEQSHPLIVVLRLSPQIPDIRFTNAVSGEKLCQAIQAIAIDRGIAQRERTQYAPNPLDPSRFSLDVPLTGWEKHMRILHEQEGRTCEDVIREYLEKPATEPFSDQLVSLGLDPEQVERDLDGENVTYFAKIAPSLSETALKNFRTKYPKMARYLAEKEVQEDLRTPQENNYIVLLSRLQTLVGGQDFAAQSVASVLSRQSDEKNSVFLFVGPTGVGKTELAKAAATLKKDQIISFHMNQFTESHSVSTLFGSSAGLVGSTSKPQLALELEKYPAAVTSLNSKTFVVRNLVILFDEFEKAHPTVRQSLLTLFDEGYCVVRYTKEWEGNVTVKYILKNSIIVATSNLCQEPVLRAFQERRSIEEIQNAFRAANKILQQAYLTSYSDELLGRMQIVPFGPIPRGEIYQTILRKKIDPFLQKLQIDLGCKKIEIENDNHFFLSLEEKLYGQGVDLRQIAFYLERIRNCVDRNKSSWGDIKNKKLIFHSEGSEIFVKLDTFSNILNNYVPTPLPERAIRVE